MHLNLCGTARSLRLHYYTPTVPKLIWDHCAHFILKVWPHNLTIPSFRHMNSPKGLMCSHLLNLFPGFLHSCISWHHLPTESVRNSIHFALLSYLRNLYFIPLVILSFFLFVGGDGVVWGGGSVRGIDQQGPEDGVEWHRSHHSPT